jgi:hypothetical protein
LENPLEDGKEAMMNAQSSPRVKLLLGVGLTALLPALAAAPVSIAAAHSFADPVASCSLPLTHDVYEGFHIGVPQGWGLSSFNDTIAVSKDTSGTEMAVVYPALVTNGLTPASFFSAYSKTLQKIAAQDGNSLSFRLTSTPGQLPQAVVSGRAGHTAVQGYAEVTLLRSQSAVSRSQVVFSAYWAPAARIRADRSVLASIGHCYGPEPGTLYRVFQDQAFAAPIPAGWQIADEGQDTIDITGDSGHALASYALMMLPPSDGATSPRLLLEKVFSLAGIQIGRIVSSTDLPNQQLANGSVQGQEYLEFTGQFKGNAVHGLAYVLSDAGSVGTTGVMRLGMASADQWNAVNSGLIRVMTSIEHSSALDQQQWAHITQQWQQFDQSVQQFDDVLRGVQEVQDPSTGTLYEAPYDTYNPSGPDGAGYYLDEGGTQVRLQTVQQ